MSASAEELAGALALLVDEPVGKVYAVDRDRPLVVHALAAIEAILRNFLTHLALRLAITARGIHKAEEGKDDPVTGAAESADWSSVEDGARPHLHTVAKDGARIGLDQVGGPLERLLSQADPRAIAWANERAAEFVTEISETTRDDVRDLVARALEEGWSNDTLADELLNAGAFSAARAEMIARTESAGADIAGNVIGWQASGLVTEKEWIVADANECDACAEMNGEKVAIDEEFPEGDPPLHPNCRCDLLPVLAEEGDE
jgi:SPP1 gp7 family putative phage head morphogenesis protein